MFHISIHCKPKIENIEFYEKVIGAFAVVIIDYKDYDGVVELSKFYITEKGWEILEVEDEYYVYENKEDMGEDYQKYYDEVREYGYSIIFNLYNEIGEE